MTSHREWISPADIVDFRRFDIPAKTLYARQKAAGRCTRFAEELYREHIRVWNGFNEKAPRKACFEDYKAAFDSIIDSISAGTFDFDRSPILVASTGQIFDGAHRTGAAWALRSPVSISPSPIDPHDAYTYEFFKRRRDFVPSGLTRFYADAIALEYCRMRDFRAPIVVVWPSAQDSTMAIKSLLEAKSLVYYGKTIHVPPRVAPFFVTHVYAGEPWCKVPASVKAKVDPCFARGSEVGVLLLDRIDEIDVAKLKAEIREMLGRGKHSIHITNDPHETARVAGLLFNDQSVRALDRGWPSVATDTFDRLLEEFALRCRGASIDTETICLSGSAVLAAHGLRDVRDLDFIHATPIPDELAMPLCSSHNSYVAGFGISPSDIVYDPRQHFYHNGMKVVGMEVWTDVMRRRGEPKDVRDLAILDGHSG